MRQGRRERSATGTLLGRVAVAIGVLLVGLVGSSAALAARGWKVVRYHHAQVVVPAGWPVYDLSSQPHVCVRFNRHAVYLGLPGGGQRCPAHAVGRTEAILLEPRAARDAAAGGEANGLLSSPGRGSSAELAMARRVVAIVTWGGDPQLLARALRVRSTRLLAGRLSLPPGAAGPAVAARTAAGPAVAARTAAGSSPGAVYTGRGFDACSAPSESQMAAWSRTHYRAVGVYIGGINMACSQPKLDAKWVSDESAAGWHLIPTYVGLQAPSNSCGCAGIDPHNASSEGAAAASDAVAQAQALGIGPGNPIYDDMEGYATGRTNSSAVLKFLSGWTAQLHADGYVSGVYSSSGSGVSDLVARVGTTYPEPDDIWFAEWNGQATTTSSYIPSADWAAHQRIHQYDGGVNETHGGVTINIDHDYLDAATAAAGSAGPPPTGAPESIASPSITGKPIVGQTLSASTGSWTGTQPISYTYEWQRCEPTCVAIPGATLQTYTLAPADAGTNIRVLVRAANAAGHGRAPSAKVGPVVLAGPAYWLYTARGNVYRPRGTPWYGSALTAHVRTSSIVGMAATADGKGYWLVSSTGAVYPFGDAARITPRHVRHAIEGIVASPAGGYWLYTARGNVYSAGIRRYGSPALSHVRTSSIVGMAATADGKGYWLVSSSGTVYPYGDAARITPRHVRHAIEGIVASPAGGYWLYTARGNVYSAGIRRYGSPALSHVRTSSIVGMAATADGRGYWLASSTGTVYPYGDAAPLPAPHPHPIEGIAS